MSRVHVVKKFPGMSGAACAVRFAMIAISPAKHSVSGLFSGSFVKDN